MTGREKSKFTNQLREQTWDKFFYRVLASAASFLLLLSRRPDAIFNAQFWAEDGKVWYADAYNQGGFSPFFVPVAGYYQTISRAVACFAQIFPLEYAPLIFNITAISVKILVINLLLSSRLTTLIPKLSGRVFLAFVYIALPHSSEAHANLTNVQWHLALLAALIILAEPSVKLFWKSFDFVMITISVLSGPFCLLLFPIAAVKIWRKRENQGFYLLVIISVGCTIQGTSMLFAQRPTEAALGADFLLFFKIVGGHVFLSSIIGERWYWSFVRHFLWNGVTASLTTLTGAFLLIYALLKAHLELRLLILFSVFIGAAALISPAITQSFPQWEIMWMPSVGVRYWCIPIFCFLTALFYLASNADQKVIRTGASVLLLLSLIGMISDWRYFPFQDLSFSRHAENFEKSNRDEEITIPINPEWEMKLIKK